MYISRTFLLIFSTITLALTSTCQVKATETIDQKDKTKFDFLYYEAMQARSLGKYDAAFDLLKYCHSLDSTNAAVLYELGNYYSSVEDKANALKMYKEAANLDEGNYYYGTSYGIMSLEQGDYDIAIKQYSLLADKYPERTNLYLYLAESYRLKKEYTKAIESLNKLEDILGMNEKISLQKFQLYRQINQEDKAFAEIQKYIDKYPSEVKYYILLGDLYLHADKNKEALDAYNKGKEISPDDPYLISSISAYYEKIGDREKSEKEIRTALSGYKMDIETKLGILAQYVTTLQQGEKDTQSANALFDTLMVIHPQEPDLNLMYGNLLSIQNKKKEAREQYQIYTDANPNNPVGWEQMLFTAYPDSTDIAIDICNRAIENNPDQAQFYFFLGLSHYAREEYDVALKALNNGIQYVDKNNLRLLSDFYGIKGDLYYHTGHVDSAFIAYDQSIKANPNNLGILNNYSYFLTLAQKDLDKAERMSSVTIKAEPLNPTYLDTYGWVLFSQKAYSMAKIYIENAVKYSEENEKEVSAEVYEHYGDVLFKTGEEEKAMEYWLKAKEAGDSKSKTLEKKIEIKQYIEE